LRFACKPDRINPRRADHWIEDQPFHWTELLEWNEREATDLVERDGEWAYIPAPSRGWASQAGGQLASEEVAEIVRAEIQSPPGTWQAEALNPRIVWFHGVLGEYVEFVYAGERLAEAISDVEFLEEVHAQHRRYRGI
jgi:hypothetical protein